MDATQLAKAKFLEGWQRRYPETPPISHFFKARLPARWARIHSLPDAKRYPTTTDEWDVLLERQNRVIEALLERGSELRIVVNFIEIDSPLFTAFEFENIGVFTDPGRETVYQSFQFAAKWEPNALNPLLTLIAEENVRAFAIGPDCLIAPYDGGMDIILKDPPTCLAFKRQFADWLSKRADGL